MFVGVLLPTIKHILHIRFYTSRPLSRPITRKEKKRKGNMICTSWVMMVLAASATMVGATLNPASSNTKGKCPSTYNCSGVFFYSSPPPPSVLTFSIPPSCLISTPPSHPILSSSPTQKLRIPYPSLPNRENSCKNLKSHPSRRMFSQHTHIYHPNFRCFCPGSSIVCNT